VSAQTQFAAKVASLINDARAMTPEIRAKVMELLNEARTRVIAELAQSDPASYTAAQLKTLSRQIDAAMQRFGTQLTSYVDAQQNSAFQIGTDTVLDPLRAAGLPAPSLAGFSDHALSIAQGYTADLITGLAKDASAKVNAAIQRAFLGGQNLGDIIGQIGKAIGGDKFTGLFSPIGARAESIAINEILRVHSMAAQARLEDAVEQVPQLRKGWAHIPIAMVPRVAHIEADGQVRDVKDPFEVDGEELMYPRDPAGSPENTINCHCLMIPVLDDSALKPMARHEQILKDAGISISTEKAA
jgi:uncharacterized protein with gpF-like domain